MFYRIFTLIRKELQTLLRDPQGRRLLIMPILLQTLLFPFAATLEVHNNVLAVENLDGGAPSIELVQRLSKAQAFTELLQVHGRDEVRSVIDNQKALMVVEIPEDFSRKLARAEPTSIQVLLDGRRSNAAQVALAYVQSVVATYAAEISGSPPISTVAVRNLFNPNLDGKWFILPSLIGIITTIGCMIVTALSIAREREQGTFEQLLVSPLTPGLIMIGKAVPAIIIAVTQATIILGASVFAFGIPFQGSLGLLYVSMVLYAIALVGIGLMISSICSTQQQAFLGVFFFMMPAILLSGFSAPIENIPEPLRTMTWINPIRHFLVITRGLYLKDFDAAMVWDHAWPLIVIAIINMIVAYIFFTRRTQ